MKIALKNCNMFLRIYNILKIENTLSIKTSYKLVQLSNKCQEHMVFYREKFEEIINQYAKKDENGNIIVAENEGIQIKDGAQDECFGRLTELDLLEVDLPDLKFSIDEFEKVNLSPEQLETLMPFLEI